MHMLAPTGKQRSWGVKSEKYFYIGTSLEHYRYFNGWHPKTKAVQGSETVLFKHKYITVPTVTPADTIVQAAKELEDAIKTKYHHLWTSVLLTSTRSAPTSLAQISQQRKQEDESVEPPRVVTKENATIARVERENKSSAQIWQRIDKKNKMFLNHPKPWTNMEHSQ